MTNPIAEPGHLHIRNSRTSEPSDVLDIIYYHTQCLTQVAGMLLELPQSVTAQANVLLGRFWLSVSPMAHEFRVSLHPDTSRRGWLADMDRTFPQQPCTS
jgi:hypothetical protein